MPSFIALTGAAAAIGAAILRVQAAFVAITDEIAIGRATDVVRDQRVARWGKARAFAADVIAAGVGVRTAALATGEVALGAAGAGRLIALSRSAAEFEFGAAPAAGVGIGAAGAGAEEAGVGWAAMSGGIALAIAAAIDAAAILGVFAAFVVVTDEIAIGGAADF